jgi:RimJ/RimL family protein N-acetyltransferase
MRPVGWADLADLVALKGDPRSFATMLGGVRGPNQVATELAEDISAWSAHGFGMWAVRGMGPNRSVGPNRFVGLVGLQDRPDGRGVAMRFALRPEEQGLGYASEAAGAALRFGHERAGLKRIIAVARDDNFGSRTVLGAIGMRECEVFKRNNVRLLVFESVINDARPHFVE